jgi:hypothetical protein
MIHHVSISRTLQAFVCILILVSVWASPTHAQILNGGFETGDLSFWTASGPGPVTVINSTAKLDGTSEVGVWNPTGGSYFAYLLASGEGLYTLLSQTFAANGGDILSFDIFFDAGDYLPFNDDGYALLREVNTFAVYPLYAQSVASVGDYQSHGWFNVNFPIPVAGLYQLEAGVRNIGDSALASAVGLDRAGLNQHPDPLLPEAASVCIWGVGALVGLFAFSRTASRQQLV